MRGGEEQRAFEPVGHDVLVQQRGLLVVVVLVLDRLLLDRHGPGDAAQRQEPGQRDPTATAHTRLNRTVAARVSHMTAASARVERARASIEPTSIMRIEVAMSTPASAASGMWATSGASASIMSASTSACVSDGEPPGGARPHVDRGARQRARGRHSAEERRHQVRHALAEQLPVRIVVLVDGHVVGDGGRQERFERAQGADGDGRGDQLGHLGEVEEARLGGRDGARQRPDDADVGAGATR